MTLRMPHHLAANSPAHRSFHNVGVPRLCRAQQGSDIKVVGNCCLIVTTCYSIGARVQTEPADLSCSRVPHFGDAVSKP
jgi:hypothetical protein